MVGIGLLCTGACVRRSKSRRVFLHITSRHDLQENAINAKGHLKSYQKVFEKCRISLDILYTHVQVVIPMWCRWIINLHSCSQTLFQAMTGLARLAGISFRNFQSIDLAINKVTTYYF